MYYRIAHVTEKAIKKACSPVTVSCGDLSFKILGLDELPKSAEQTTDLNILLGTKAARLSRTLYPEVLRVNAMIPYPYNKKEESGENTSDRNIYIDQPYSRYFDLIKSAIPRAKRVGVLVHASNTSDINKLEITASSRGFILNISTIDEERNVGEALTRLLDNTDVLLALPDARIHNSKTISHILTTSYRNNIPVIGFSSAYVKAGATAAVYTSPENIAAQLSEYVVSLLTDRAINEKSQMAKYFSITYNYEVARSLGLPTISTREIHSFISKGEAQ